MQQGAAREERLLERAFEFAPLVITRKINDANWEIEINCYLGWRWYIYASYDHEFIVASCH